MSFDPTAGTKVAMLSVQTSAEAATKLRKLRLMWLAPPIPPQQTEN